MENLNNKINSLTQKFNSKMEKLNKLNAQIETTDKLIKKCEAELELRHELYDDCQSIRNDISGLKEEFMNDNANFLLDHIEKFAKIVLSKFKELDNAENKFLKYMNIDNVNAVNNKIEVTTTLNNTRKLKIKDLKVEITNLEDQINKLKAELIENSEDDSWDFNTEDAEDVEEIDM